MTFPHDLRGRLALGCGGLCIAGGIAALLRARSLRQLMQVEGIEAASEWRDAMRLVQRPDDLTGAAICFIVAGLALIAWAFVRASRS